MEVTFKPHEGRHMATGEIVQHPQLLVLFDGIQTGWLPTHKGGKLFPIRTWSYEECQAAKRAAKKLTGEEPEVVQPMVIPPEIIAKLQEQDGQQYDDEDTDDDE